MGGFMSVLTKLTGWLLKRYQRFTFRKSSIKKLYYYSRTKNKFQNQNEEKFDEHRATSEKSNATILLSDGSDFDQKELD
jgi:hypothetical protein